MYNNNKKLEANEINRIVMQDRYSLRLAKVNNVYLNIEKSPWNDSKKINFRFCYNNIWYRYIGNTDIKVYEKYKESEVGEYYINSECYIVVSLTDAYDKTNSHYKLVATLI